MDISTFRLFQAVRSYKSEEKTNRPYIKVRFANKGIDKLNLGQILNHKTVTEKIPPYFKRKETPCISYSYTPTVASKIFNYKRFLQCIDLSNPSLHPLPCECSSSDFNYSPCGHVITGDLSIVKNDKLRELLKKGPKYRESNSFTWNQNFKIIMAHRRIFHNLHGTCMEFTWKFFCVTSMDYMEYWLHVNPHPSMLLRNPFHAGAEISAYGIPCKALGSYT